MNRFRTGLVAAALLVTPTWAEPPQPNDLLNERGRPALTEESIDAVIEKSVEHYTAMRRGRAPATPELFGTWVAIARHYHGMPESEALTEEARDAYANYRSRWGGFLKAREELDPPLEQMVLADLATHHAHWARRGLGYHGNLARNRQFLDDFDTYATFAKELGLISDRDAAVMLDMIAERAESAPVAAGTAMLRSARYQFKRADEKLDEGNDFGGLSLVRLGVESLYGARSFGVPRSDIREVLDSLPLDGGSATYEDKEYSFGGLVDLAINELVEREQLGGESVTLPSGESKPESDLGRFVERVTVGAAPGQLTRELYILEELELLVADAAGEVHLERHDELARLGTILFHGLFRDVVGKRDYENLKGLYEQAGGEEFMTRGREILTHPAIHEELYKSGDIVRVEEQLPVVDGPGIWRDIGDQYVARGQQLRERATETSGAMQRSLLSQAGDAWGEARERYAEAIDRYRQAPIALHHNVAAAAGTERNIRDAIGEPASHLTDVMRDAYTTILDQGVPRDVPDDVKDINYRIYVSAAAQMALLERQEGDPGDEYRRQLLRAEPENGNQYFFRGTVRSALLKDEGAVDDFKQAYTLFEKSGNPRASEAARMVRSLGGELPSQ